MKKIRIFMIGTMIAFLFSCCASISAKTPATKEQINREAFNLLRSMSLKEKIGQKLMLDFRYWCSTTLPADQPCDQDLTRINPIVKNIMSQNHIGGIVLFSNNLKDITQITTLTEAFQRTMQETRQLPLLIATDQEGGILARLPRQFSVSFPGNMAIAAAYLGHPQVPYSTEIGKMMAADLKAVGININFAPDVDVNVNPLNPIISVRSFSDEPLLVSRLGLALSRAIQAERVGSTLKHFPGHGDTAMDSHLGLPVVTHSLKQAWKIDLYPFQKIIEQQAPDLIMTAHIQFPALDNNRIYAPIIGENIITPATLSRKIEYNLLRKKLGYQGIIITDALDMGAIVQNFDPTDATIKAFQAGDDIALMPVAVSQPEDAAKVTDLISSIALAVQNKKIQLAELDQSVLRILRLKIKLGLLQPDHLPLAQKISQAQRLLANKNQRELESNVTNDAVTLVQNNLKLLPIKLLSNARIHILTPWLEQGVGIAVEIKRLQMEHQLPQHLKINIIKIPDVNLEAEKKAVDNADIVIVGNSATGLLPLISNKVPHPQGTLVFPDMPEGDKLNSPRAGLPLENNVHDAQFAYQVLQYAKKQGKKAIFISLLAPYDLPTYQDVSDAMLAVYDYYGYLTHGGRRYYRGPSMPALTRIIFGVKPARGKLPINIPNPSQPVEIIYPRGYGLVTD